VFEQFVFDVASVTWLRCTVTVERWSLTGELSLSCAAEYCNSEKNLLSTDGCSTRNATFGELWPTNPRDPRVTKFFKNDARE